MKKILICAPTYNESKNIRKFCSEVLNLKHNLDLIIIDDNSPDGTSEIIKKLKFKYKNLILLKRLDMVLIYINHNSLNKDLANLLAKYRKQ